MAELLYKEREIEVRLESSHSIEHQDLLFFHSNEFINRKKESTPLFFNLYVDGKNLVSIVFEVIDQVAISLPQSPFGGIITGAVLNSQLIDKLLKTVIKYFKRTKQSLEIRLRPVIYSENESSYLDFELEVNFTEINQHISVDLENFQGKLNRNRKRKLELNIDLGHKFQQLDMKHLRQSYDLIRECRIDKGYPVTMSLEQLHDAFNTFPDRYLLFGVYDKSELIATAVSIRVSNNILYNFYHGDRLNHRTSSPVTMLVAGIYTYCQEQSVEILDLGISSQDGKLNEGLFYFKRSCGAVSSDKVNYQLKA